MIHWPYCIILLTGICLLGCSSLNNSGFLKSSLPAKINIYNDQFITVGRLGDIPVEINSPSQVERYGLISQGRPTEYLIMLQPNKVRGDVVIPIESVPQWIESLDDYREYIDQILEAHRRFLNGQVYEAETIISELVKRYNHGFGTTVISGNIALLRGQYERAREFYDLAQKLKPNTLDAVFTQSGK